MLKYSIKNTGGDPVTVFGRNTLHILPYVEGIFDLPDTPQTRKLMSRLSREYPLLRIAQLEAAVVTPEKRDTAGVATSDDKPSVASPAVLVGMDKETFSAAVKEVRAAGSGWSTVAVSGIAEPIRVRGGKDDAATIALAFDAYLKMTTPVEG